MEVNGIGTAQTGSAALAAGTGLAENFETFLLLLTKQLENQDPLAPMDSVEFTSQLAQFTNVEQSIATNRNLELLLGLIRANQFAGAVAFIGKTVEVQGQEALLADGRAEWSYTLADNAASTIITIFNAAGEPVYAGPGETSAGVHALTWNGLDSNGAPQPPGVYRIGIVALDGDGNQIPATTSLSGQVTAVEMIDGQQMLVVGNMLVPLSEVKSVRETPAGGA